MSWLGKLFGSKESGSEPAAVIEYKGYKITPRPQREGKSFRIAATIEGEVKGEAKAHHLIRADTLESKDAADEASIGKAKQMIDQMGDMLFD